MQLLYIMLSDAAQVSNGKMFILGGGWDVLTVPAGQVAGTHMSCVALSLSVPWAEMGAEHEITLELHKDSQRIGQIGSAKLSMPRPPANQFLKARVAMLALPLQLSAAVGEYQVKVLVDGKELGGVRYSVMALAAN